MQSTIRLFAFLILFSIPLFGQGKLNIEPYDFVNSKKEVTKAELGYIKVPENRSVKDSRMIELAFVRFKSTSSNPGPPIVYLAGGPGGSGIGTARRTRFELFMQMREFGDVIAFDQRGTGMSKPNLRCNSRLNLPLDKPLERSQMVDQLRKRVRKCIDDWTAKGADVRGYNTNESADDLNDLRKALGAKKIRLWGISYGTHLSLATIRRHGKHIDSAILAGIEGMDDTLKLPSNTDALIDELTRRAKEDPGVNKATPDLKALIGEVLAQLEDKPMTIKVTTPGTNSEKSLVVGKFDVQFAAAGASGNNGFQAIFPQLFLGIKAGQFGPLGGYLLSLRSQGIPSLMTTAMDCTSGATKKRMMRIRREAKTALMGDAINAPFPDFCDVFPEWKVDDSFRSPVKSDIPVLFISGTLDGRTPVSNADTAIEGFANSHHLIIDGAGHSDPLFLSTPTIAERMGQFFGGKKLKKVEEIEMSKPFRFVPIK